MAALLLASVLSAVAVPLTKKSEPNGRRALRSLRRTVLAQPDLPILGWKVKSEGYNASAFGPPGILSGCTYKVQEGNDTLQSIAKSMDIEMDEIRDRNSVDISDPNNLKNGMSITIPCPGTDYYKYKPLHIAGCFFEWVIDSQHPSIWSVVKNPPADVPGPFSITGIWTANFQALRETNTASVDLTAPGAWYTGRKIYLPTCAHAGTIMDDIPVKNATGCFLDLNGMSLQQAADGLKIPLANITAINPQYASNTNSTGSNSTINIPCPS